MPHRIDLSTDEPAFDRKASAVAVVAKRGRDIDVRALGPYLVAALIVG